MRNKLDELDFDFQDFTIERFKEWVGNKRGRKIFFIGAPLTPELDGFWMSDAELPSEYIVFDDSVPPVHQAHIQLHELAHLICSHDTEKITTAKLSAILDALDKNSEPCQILESALHRSPNKRSEDAEAETLAALIQEQAIRRAGLEKLAHASYNNKEAMAWVEEMGLL